MKERSKGRSQEQAAVKANIKSRKTVAKYEQAGKLPSELKKPRTYRTRKDPFEEDWPEVEQMLAAARYRVQQAEASVSAAGVTSDEQLAAELQRLSGSDRFGFIAQHRGMFSRLGATPEQVERLREEHAIYMVGDSRLNIAGLNKHTVPVLAKAIVDVGI